MRRKRSVSPGEGTSSRKVRPLPNAVDDTFEDHIFQNLFEDDPFENMSESCKSIIRSSMHSSSYLTHDNIYPWFSLVLETSIQFRSANAPFERTSTIDQSNAEPRYWQQMHKPLLYMCGIDNDTIFIFNRRPARQNRQLPEDWISHNGIKLSCFSIENYQFPNIFGRNRPSTETCSSSKLLLPLEYVSSSSCYRRRGWWWRGITIRRRR
jgi:hypothetical protein